MNPTPPRPVVLDCDPGQDDAVMLLLALASREALDVRGVTAVAGNVPLPLTQRNARLVLDLAGVTDVPVFAGCDRPLRVPLRTAESVHGQTGIDGVPITEPRTPLQATHAVDFIIEAALAAGPDGLTLVPTGPLTNVASAMLREPRILPCIREIVLMGGAMREAGNATPSAEFNMLVDPHAADVVLHCGRPLVIAPLDLTHQVLVTRAVLQRLRGLDTAVGRAVVAMLEYFNRHDTSKYASDGAPLHDPCTVAWLLRPGLFTGKQVNVEVETDSPLTLGHLAVDFWGVTGRAANALWLHRVDAEGFFDLLLERLGRHAP